MVGVRRVVVVYPSCLLDAYVGLGVSQKGRRGVKGWSVDGKSWS